MTKFPDTTAAATDPERAPPDRGSPAPAATYLAVENAWVSDDAKCLLDAYATTIRELEAKLANVDARRADAERLTDAYATTIRDLEAKLASARAERADARQLAEQYGIALHALEARLATSQAIQKDLERRLQESQRALEAVEFGHRGPDSPLEAFFREHGLVTLADKVKRCRERDEARHPPPRPDIPVA